MDVRAARRPGRAAGGLTGRRDRRPVARAPARRVGWCGAVADPRLGPCGPVRRATSTTRPGAGLRQGAPARPPDRRRRSGERLGDATSLVNVGAGAGSYEPPDSPSRRRALGGHACPTPGHLARPWTRSPRTCPSAMTLRRRPGPFTVHQWPDLARGLVELRRVARGPVVVLTLDPVPLRLLAAGLRPRAHRAGGRRMPPIDLSATCWAAVSSSNPSPSGGLHRRVRRSLLRSARGLLDDRVRRCSRRGLHRAAVPRPAAWPPSGRPWTTARGTAGTGTCGPCPSTPAPSA